MNKILVIGSSNTDMVIKTDRLPCPGETIVNGTFMANSGGKGANQAVAAARLGGDVTFVTKRGNDLFGNKSIGLLMREGIDTQYVIKDMERPSGVALISVDSEGRSSSVTAPGANSYLLPENIPDIIFERGKFEILLLQLEIPLSTVVYSVIKANNNGTRIILNPAPVKEIPEGLYRHLWLITPNETEAEMLTGVKVYNESSAEKASDIFLKRGVKNVIISMGADGAYVKSQNFTGTVPAVKVSVVDITAAGDVFNGALAVALSEGKDFRDAIIFANKAASISATRMGSQASAPYRKEISELHTYAKNKSYAHFSFINQTGLSV